MIPIVAPRVAGDKWVIRVDQLLEDERVRVVCAVRRKGRGDLACRASAIALGRIVREAPLDVRRGHHEVLVAQVGLEVMSFDEALELALELRIGEAIGNRRIDRALVRGVRVGVEHPSAEVHVVARERARRVVVLRGHEVRVLIAAAVVGQIPEPLLQPGDVLGTVGTEALGAPEHDVVSVRRHHRTAVVVDVPEHRVEGTHRSAERYVGRRMSRGPLRRGRRNTRCCGYPGNRNRNCG